MDKGGPSQIGRTCTDTEQHRYELPRLSRAERDRRWGETRELMAGAGIDCLLAYGGPGALSAQYLTHIDMEGLAIFPAERDPLFLLPSGERWLHWATGSQDWVQDVRPVHDVASAAGEVLEGLNARRLGLVDFRGMAAGLYTDVMNAVSDYPSEDATKLVYELRLVKSDEEIAMMWWASWPCSPAPSPRRRIGYRW